MITARTLLRLSFLAALVVATPRISAAQLSVGGSVGGAFDTPDNWVLFGGEARYSLGTTGIDINPRVTWWPNGNSINTLQVDANALYNWPVAATIRFRPYTGVGVAIQRVSGNGNSNTEVGGNLAAGVRFDTKTPLKPFAHYQYSIIHDQINTAMMSVGVLFQL